MTGLAHFAGVAVNMLLFAAKDATPNVNVAGAVGSVARRRCVSVFAVDFVAVSVDVACVIVVAATNLDCVAILSAIGAALFGGQIAVVPAAGAPVVLGRYLVFVFVVLSAFSLLLMLVLVA